jgi:mRNA interferase MazF
VVKRGEVYWYRFKSPDKRRPILVLTRSDLVDHLGTVTVAAITSTRRGVASEVGLGPELGLPKACAANLHNVVTIPKDEIGPYITALPDAVMAQVDRAIAFALGLGERAPTEH